MLTKKTIGFLLKIGIVAFALFFLYQQLITKNNIDQFQSVLVFEKLKMYSWAFVLVLLLMFINWILEALKWRFLIAKIEKISLRRAISAIFSGITISAFTPNRVGEYGGRVFCLEKADRIQGVLITVIGSVAQLITTIFFGSLGIILLANYKTQFSAMLDGMEFAFIIIVFILVLLNVLLVLLFLNAPLMSTLLSKIRLLQKYTKYSKVFAFYNAIELGKVLIYSVARYFVFTTQFFILLQVFGVEIQYTDAIVFIMTMLLVISVIPTIAITEIGVRGSVALFLFGIVSTNTVGILAATFVMWIVNLLLPALIGTLFIFSLKFFRK